MKVCVVVTARPSFAKWQTVLEALRDKCELQVVVGCSALLERYGCVGDVIRQQGYQIAAEAWTVLEGETLLTGAREAGVAAMEFASIFHRLRPDVVCVMADRREVLAAAMAAAYQHIRLAHVQGGESSGSVDDRVRNAITALADVHFPATEAAFRNIADILLTNRRQDDAFRVGCPSIDLALRAAKEPRVKPSEIGGAGAALEMGKGKGLPLVVWLQHPVTNEADEAAEQMATTAHALARGCYDVLAFWPGQDAGSGAMAKVLRQNQGEMHTVRNLPPMRFLKLLTQAACLVGNSSAGIRECSALGVPVVNIGNRQHGRERGPNVVDVPHDADAIARAIESQITHGPYERSTLYGDGHAGKRIADVLLSLGAHSGTSRQQGHSGEKLQAAS